MQEELSKKYYKHNHYYLKILKHHIEEELYDKPFYHEAILHYIVNLCDMDQIPNYCNVKRNKTAIEFTRITRSNIKKIRKFVEAIVKLENKK